MMQKAATDADEYISSIHCHDDDDVDRFGECRFSICLFGSAALEGWRRRRRRDEFCGIILGRWAMRQSSNALEIWIKETADKM